MAKCPNCNSELSLSGVCPACGYVAPTSSNDPYGESLIKKGKYDAARGQLEKLLQKNPNDGKANLLFVRCLTQNFTAKSRNSAEALEHAVKGLTYATEKEKNEYKALFSQYFENERNGGKSIKMVFDRTSDTFAVDGGTTATSYSSSASSSGSSRGGKSRRSGGGNGKKILIAAGSLVVTGAIALTLVFTLGSRNKGTRVSFDTNGGSGGSSYVTNYYKKRPSSINIPTRLGYKFTGYWTKTTYTFNGEYVGSGKQYYESTGSCLYSTWPVAKRKLTLYASWEESSTRVSFMREGGTGGTESTTIRGGESNVQISVPIKAGYTFKGYYTSTNGSGTKYFDYNGKLVPSQSPWKYNGSSLTLYAYWSSGTPTTVTFNAGYGSGGTTTIVNTLGDPYESITIPTRYGYQFRGYYTDTYGSGTRYYDSYGDPCYSTWTYSGASLTLYAYWW